MFVALALLALAADPKPRAAPLFVAHSTADAPKVGSLAKLFTDWSATLADPDAQVPAGELVSLRRSDVPLPAAPHAVKHVRLANGDVFRLDDLRGEDALTVTATVRVGGGEGSQPLTLSLSALSVVWLTDPPAGTPADPDRYSWFDPTKKQDALLLQNGDVVRGTLERFGGLTTVRFKPADENAAKVYDRTAVAAVALDPSLSRVKKPAGPYARIVTSDGSRVSVASAASDGQAFALKTLTGGSLSLPVAELVALDVMHGKAKYLSDLKPKAVKVEPYGAVEWPPMNDRSAKGAALRLKTARGEETFDKGLGTHSKTTVTYELGGKYRRFEATVGLDAASGKRGAADVRVLVDGKDVGGEALKALTAAAVQVVSIDVTKAKELTLVIDYGPGGDVQDDVDWADARLVE